MQAIASRWSREANRVVGLSGLAIALFFLSGTTAYASTEPMTVWAAVSDTLVRADQPTVSFGTSKFLYADGSPEKRIYLRFVVTGAPSGPQHTILRLNQTTANPFPPFCEEVWECWRYIRVSVRPVGAGDWDESTTWATAPPVGEVIGMSPNEQFQGYFNLVEIDLGMLVDGDGIYELAVTGDTRTNYTFMSRENLSPPRLVIVP